jgi:hypothetical protein
VDKIQLFFEGTGKPKENKRESALTTLEGSSLAASGLAAAARESQFSAIVCPLQVEVDGTIDSKTKQPENEAFRNSEGLSGPLSEFPADDDDPFVASTFGGGGGGGLSSDSADSFFDDGFASAVSENITVVTTPPEQQQPVVVDEFYQPSPPEQQQKVAQAAAAKDPDCLHDPGDLALGSSEIADLCHELSKEVTDGNDDDDDEMSSEEEESECLVTSTADTCPGCGTQLDPVRGGYSVNCVTFDVTLNCQGCGRNVCVQESFTEGDRQTLESRIKEY